MYWAQESKQDLVILLLDFKKDYDRINWSFLKAVMRKLGFAQEWIEWTTTMYKGAQASILVNGIKEPKFTLERLVLQRCPLAPYLFLFIADAIIHMLDDPQYAVRGLILPDGSKIWAQLFVDDTYMYSHGTEENLEPASVVLTIFCRASRMRIN